MMIDGVGRGTERRPLHQLRARLRARRGVPAAVRRRRRRPDEAWAAFDERYLDGSEADYQAARVGAAPSDGRPPPAPRSASWRVAEAFRGDGEILASPIGTDADARRPARPGHASSPTCSSPTARRCFVANDLPARRRRQAWSRAGSRSGTVFDVVWARPAPRDDGRHPGRPVRQPEHRLHRPVGAARRRSCSASAARPGNTVNNPTSYWVPQPLHRVFVEQVDWSSGVGYDRAAGRRRRRSTAHHEIRRVVTNLARARLRDARPPHAAARRCTPASPSTRSSRPPASRSSCPTDVAETRLPTDEELRLHPRGRSTPAALRRAARCRTP